MKFDQSRALRAWANSPEATKARALQEQKNAAERRNLLADGILPALSPHCAWLTHEQVFRFVFRIDRQPLDNAPTTPHTGANRNRPSQPCGPVIQWTFISGFTK